jgi:hypothetical protein
MRETQSRIYTPLPPTFVVGPAALLLTNGNGWRAHVTFDTGVAMEGGTGELLALGSKLRFTPEYPGKVRKREREGRFSFIWDVAEHKGLVLSDALQAYAPMSSGLQATNMTRADTGAGQRLEGHACQAQEVTVQMNDGSSAVFHALVAPDLGGLALQVQRTSGSSLASLSLSKIRLEAVPADEFTRLDGLTRYASAEAIADELAAREHNLRRPSSPMAMPEELYQGPPRRQP